MEITTRVVSAMDSGFASLKRVQPGFETGLRETIGRQVVKRPPIRRR
jgi:hypothetical protein